MQSTLGPVEKFKSTTRYLARTIAHGVKSGGGFSRYGYEDVGSHGFGPLVRFPESVHHDDCRNRHSEPQGLGTLNRFSDELFRGRLHALFGYTM